MPEYELHFIVICFEHGKDVIEECFEQFERVGTNIVEEELDGVEGVGSGGFGELLACEFGRQCHDDKVMSSFSRP